MVCIYNINICIYIYNSTHALCTSLPHSQHPYSGGAPLLLHSAENIALSVAANLASNRMTNVSQDGSMEAVFKTEHLGN